METFNKKPTIIIALSLFLLLGCKQEIPITNENNTIVNAKFNLKKDLFDFSNRLSNGDTLILLADLSISTSWHSEKNIFYRNNGNLITRSWNYGEFVEPNEKILDEISYNPKDTLTFENLFQNFEHSIDTTNLKNSKRFSVIYSNDTVVFHSEGLIESMRMEEYYMKIKNRLYPDIDLYKPVLPIED